MVKSKKFLAIFISLALVLSLAISVFPMASPVSADPGNHYYVATTGDDTTGDGSLGNPWQTITHAVDNVPAGNSAFDPNVIHVADGTYDNTTNGEVFPITFDNPNVTLVADSTGALIDQEYIGTGTGRILKIEATGITIDGFTLNRAGFGIEADCGGFNILNNTFSNTSDWGIDRGVFVNISECGLDDDFSFDPILIEDNEFNITSDGVWLKLDIDFDHLETNLDMDIGDIDIFDNDFNMNDTYGVNMCIEVSDVYGGDVTIGDIDISDGNTFTNGDWGVYFDSHLEDLDDATVEIGDLMVNGNTFTDQSSYAVYIDSYYDNYRATEHNYGENNWRGDTTVTIGDIEVNGNDISSTSPSCDGIYIYEYGYWEYIEDDVVIEAGGVYVEDNDSIDVEGHYGIYVDYYYLEYFIDNAEATLGDLSIQDNVITAGSDSGDYAIYVYFDDVGYDFEGNSSFTSGDFYISGNEITDCGEDAIYVYFDNFGEYTSNYAEVTLGDLYIEDNEIGTNTEAGGDGIYVYYYDFYEFYDYSQVIVGDVHIEDNGPINANDYGIYLYYYEVGAYLYNNARCTVGETSIMNNTGIDVTTNEGIYVDYDMGWYNYGNSECDIGDCHIEGNEIGSDGDNVGGDGIYLYYSYFAYELEDDSAFTFGDTFIKDNDIYADDYGMYIYYYECAYYMYDDSTATIGDLNIEDNDIYAANNEGIYIEYCESAYENESDTVATFGDINITGNDIEANDDDGIYLYMDYFGAYLDGSARANFGDVNILENDAIDADDYGIYLYFGDYFGYELYNSAVFMVGDCNIQDNVITANTGDGIYVLYYDGYDIYDNARWTVGNLNIEDNDVTSVSDDGIYVYYDYCAADVEDYAIARIGSASICNNGISAGCGYGVYLEYYCVGYCVYDSAQVFVGNANISGNHALGDDNAPLTSTSGGIYLYYDECGAYTYDYSKVTFGNVTMQNNGIDAESNGIYVYYYEVGYYMYDSSDVVIGTLDIAGNDIDATSEAIYFYYYEVAYEMTQDDIPCEATLTMGDISVCNNTIAGDDDGVYIEYCDSYVGYDLYDDAYAKLPSYVITGNTFNVTGNGIYYEAYDVPYDLYDDAVIDFGGMLIDDNTFNGETRNIADPMDCGVYIYFDVFCYDNYDHSKTIVGDYTITNNELYDLDSEGIYVYYYYVGNDLEHYSTLEMGDLEIAGNTIAGADYGVDVEYDHVCSYNDSTLTMGNLDITGNEISDITTHGIYVYYYLEAYNNSTQTIGRALIQDNTLDGSSEDGIRVSTSLNSDPGATINLGEPIIDGNIITEWLHGIYLEDVDGATVTSNFIMDNDCGIYLDGSDNVAISNNDILRNPGAASGVHLDADCGPDTTINYNNIVANSSGDWGVYNACTNVIDAENNWWGDPSGPDDDAMVINGTGDKISNYVDADPWLTTQSLVTIYEQTTTATASGTASVQTDGGAVIDWEAVPEGDLPAAGKPDLVFPHGFFSFKIIGLEVGQEVTVTLTLPGNVPVGTEYWKYGPTPDDPTDHWYSIPIEDDDGDNVITFTLVDGGLGDHDEMENGEIEEPGAPGYVRPVEEEEEEEEEEGPPARALVEAAEGEEAPSGAAQFVVRNLTVSPTEVPANQPVGIQVDVTNMGQAYGYYDAVLLIDGEKEGGHRVYLQPGTSQRLSFQVSRPVAGTYNVSVANQGGYFTVKETEYEVELGPAQTGGGLGTPALIAIILGAVGVGIAIFFARRRTA